MIKQLLIITLGCIIMIQMGCKKEGCKKEPEKFTIKGRMVDGSTDFRYKNLTFEVYGADRNENASDKLGSFTTNDAGEFEFIYEKEKGSYSIMLLNSFIRFKKLPVNQDIDKIFYKSTWGKLDIFLKTDRLLQDHKDTLYLYRYIDNTQKIDTFTNLSGVHKISFSPPPGEMGFYYGRNSSEFVYDNLNKYVIQAKKASSKIDGDPYMNELTINY